MWLMVELCKQTNKQWEGRMSSTLGCYTCSELQLGKPCPSAATDRDSWRAGLSFPSHSNLHIHSIHIQFMFQVQHFHWCELYFLAQSDKRPHFLDDKDHHCQHDYHQSYNQRCWCTIMITIISIVMTTIISMIMTTIISMIMMTIITRKRQLWGILGRRKWSLQHYCWKWVWHLWFDHTPGIQIFGNFVLTMIIHPESGRIYHQAIVSKKLCSDKRYLTGVSQNIAAQHRDPDAKIKVCLLHWSR